MHAFDQYKLNLKPVLCKICSVFDDTKIKCICRLDQQQSLILQCGYLCVIFNKCRRLQTILFLCLIEALLFNNTQQN